MTQRPTEATSSATRLWVHRPADGPVAWGAAVLVVPIVPLLSFFVLVAIRAIDTDAASRGDLDPLCPVPWALVGAGTALFARGRLVRGVGLGLLAGSVASFVLVSLLTWGWAP